MTPQPMYYRDLIGYPPAPAGAVEFALIHRDMKQALESEGWLMFDQSASSGYVSLVLESWRAIESAAGVQS